MTAQRKRPAPGYSMIELSVVIALTGLVLAASLPAFARFQRSTAMRNAHRQIALDLRLARQKAMAEHHNFVAVFAAGPPSTYGVFADEDNDLTQDAGERWILQRGLPEGMTLDASALAPADSVAFTSSGRLPGAWTGGVVNMSRSDGSEVRSLRAWPSGSIETFEP